jgi:hypothetical protein
MLARMAWTRIEHLQFSVMMGLRDGLKSIRGMRRALTEDEQHKTAEKIVATSSEQLAAAEFFKFSR